MLVATHARKFLRNIRAAKHATLHSPAENGLNPGARALQPTQPPTHNPSAPPCPSPKARSSLYLCCFKPCRACVPPGECVRSVVLGTLGFATYYRNAGAGALHLSFFIATLSERRLCCMQSIQTYVACAYPMTGFTLLREAGEPGSLCPQRLPQVTAWAACWNGLLHIRRVQRAERLFLSNWFEGLTRPLTFWIRAHFRDKVIQQTFNIHSSHAYRCTTAP